MNAHNPNFDIDFERGLVGENLVRQVAQGVFRGKTEVKTDYRWRNTGNVYIEFECCKAAGWSPSGISSTEADTWAFVLDGMVVTFPVDFVIEYVNRAKAKNKVREQTDGSHPTVGVVASIHEMIAAYRMRANRKAAS
jgi:hypothetical protein